MASALPGLQFNKPIQFHDFLSRLGLVDIIYRAMANPDLSEITMAVLDIMQKTSTMPKISKVTKNENKSTAYRNQGNMAYSQSEYQEALVYYNTALLYAPNDSRALKLAFSNRSALLNNLKAFSKCIKDIEMCFNLGCPPDIHDKLKKRYEAAKSYLWMERLAERSEHNAFSEAFFNFEVRRNPQISSASTDVGVIVENHVPRIVATTNVKVGVVLAIENSFVSITSPKNFKISCYHCQKIDLNLRPCHKCCYALFCSEDCRETALKEYHSIECQIMDVLEMISGGFISVPRLAVKAVLKILYLSKTWKEFIAESKLLGLRRMKKNSVNQIFDVNYKFSLLSAKDERHFLHGPMYNASFICAVLINFLDTLPDIFPQGSDEKLAAQRAFARMFMFLNLHCPPSEVIPGVTVHQQEKMEFHEVSNFAWFSLVGKLKRTCNSNTVMVNLNKRLAIVTKKPIKMGEDITVTKLDARHQNEPVERQYSMMALQGVVCNCPLCTGQYALLPHIPLNDMQRKNFQKLNITEMAERLCPRNAPEYFTKLCKTLAFLNNVQFTKEYKEAYSLFRRCILYFQDVECKNEMLDYL